MTLTTPPTRPGCDPLPGEATPTATTWQWTLDAWSRGWTWRDPSGDLWWADTFKMPAGDSALPATWQSLPAEVWLPASLDLAGLDAPPVLQSTLTTGIFDHGVYERSGALLDVGDSRDIFYRSSISAPATTGLPSEVIASAERAPAVGAWNPAEPTGRPDELEPLPDDSGLGFEIGVLTGEDEHDWTFAPGPLDNDPQPHPRPERSPIPHEHPAWTERPPEFYPHPEPIPWDRFITMDTLRWALRSGLIGPSRQPLVNRWAGRHG